jgi:glycosyltransferase involved in cell wall biosynthesis
MSKIKVIIPAYNEEKAIAHVIKKFQIQLGNYYYLTFY